MTRVPRLGLAAVLAAVLVAVLAAACGPADERGGGAATGAATASAPTLRRVSVVGASMSAGLGGMPVAEAVVSAAPGAAVDDQADVAMFTDAPARGRAQVDGALATAPELVIALDFLFWYAYNAEGGERAPRVEAGLAELARLRAAGATVVVGDVPRITTAPRLIPPAAVPSEVELASINARIRSWGAAAGPRALVVPFASWAEPLAAGAEVELPDGGGRVSARSLVAPDGLHPNARGVWYVLRRLDAAMEAAGLAAPGDLVFAPPAAAP